MTNKTFLGVFTAITLYLGVDLFIFGQTEFEMVRGIFWLMASGYLFARFIRKVKPSEDEN